MLLGRFEPMQRHPQEDGSERREVAAPAIRTAQSLHLEGEGHRLSTANGEAAILRLEDEIVVWKIAGAEVIVLRAHRQPAIADPRFGPVMKARRGIVVPEDQAGNQSSGKASISTEGNQESTACPTVAAACAQARQR